MVSVIGVLNQHSMEAQWRFFQLPLWMKVIMDGKKASKGIQADFLMVFQLNIENKENIWARKQPMKTMFLKNSYLYGK